jgi:hypothetical protein
MEAKTEKKTEPTITDKSVTAFRRIYNALEPLTPSQKRRVLEAVKLLVDNDAASEPLP